MNYKEKHKLLGKKLDILKDIINGLNSHSMELINISAKMEMKLRNKKLSREEIILLEKGLDGMIKKVFNTIENNNPVITIGLNMEKSNQ